MENSNSEKSKEALRYTSNKEPIIIDTELENKLTSAASIVIAVGYVAAFAFIVMAFSNYEDTDKVEWVFLIYAALELIFFYAVGLTMKVIGKVSTTLKNIEANRVNKANLH